MENKDSAEQAARTVRISIFDQIYSLRSPKGEEHIRRIAEVVDERMRQISAHTTTFELSRIAVLAALNIADELQDLKARELSPLPAPTPPEPQSAEAAMESPATTEATGKAQTWFEAIFDAEVPVKERSERLSSQISTRLQTGRAENPKDADAADMTDD
jgi:cell division protein ZapA (FtsZ GTPase activity inhibitor)